MQAARRLKGRHSCVRLIVLSKGTVLVGGGGGGDVESVSYFPFYRNFFFLLLIYARKRIFPVVIVLFISISGDEIHEPCRVDRLYTVRLLTVAETPNKTTSFSFISFGSIGVNSIYEYMFQNHKLLRTVCTYPGVSPTLNIICLHVRRIHNYELLPFRFPLQYENAEHSVFLTGNIKKRKRKTTKMTTSSSNCRVVRESNNAGVLSVKLSIYNVFRLRQTSDVFATRRQIPP